MGNSKFFITLSNDVVLELHATTDIQIRTPTKVTNFPVESGADLTDNIVLGATTISMSGVLTDVLTQQDIDSFGLLDPTDWITAIRANLNKKDVVDVTYSYQLPPLKSCVVTEFSIQKDKSLGGDSWSVSLSFQQVRFKRQARKVSQPRSDLASFLAEKKSAKASVDSADPCRVSQKAIDNLKAQGYSETREKTVYGRMSTNLEIKCLEKELFNT